MTDFIKTKYFVVAVILVLGAGAYFIFKSPSGGSPATGVEDQASSGDTGNADLAAAETGVADADGFVRMPGEASRGGNGAYVVTGDTCEQFTVKYVEGLTGKKVLRTDSPGDSSACQYFISEQNKNLMFQIAVGFLSVENQRAAFEYLGWKVTKEPRIPMDNFVVYQEDGHINKIYLVLGPEKFITVDRSGADALSETEIMDLAIKLGDKAKDFQ
jgi:hypothetical protein